MSPGRVPGIIGTHGAGQGRSAVIAGQARARNPRGTLAAAVFAALVAATAGGLLLAQSLKHAPAGVQGFLTSASFEPSSAGASSLEQISFHTVRPDRLTVSIVSSGGETVATLVRDLQWPARRRLCLAWNGHRGTGGLRLAGDRAAAALASCEPAAALRQPTGGLAAAGEYRVRVGLGGEGVAVPSPHRFALLGPGGGSGAAQEATGY